jgi:SEC-C motif-containing protein
MAELACPCGGKSLASCCGPYLSGERVAPTAEALMRSRYTAYALGDDAYVRATWAVETRPSSKELGEQGLKWLGLEVKKHVPDGDRATVEFVARYKIAGQAHRLHEVSRFVREDGRWYYLDGSFPEPKNEASKKNK